MADTWTAVIGRLGMPTGDGRAVLADGFSIRTLPLPIDWQEHTDEGHDDAVTIGRIDTVTPDYTTGLVTATGVFLNPDIIEEVPRVMELIRNGIVYPSMQPAACNAEWWPTGGGEGYFDEQSGWQDAQPYGETMVFTKFELAKVTLVAVQAFPEMSITLDSGMLTEANPEPALTAAVRSSGWSSMPVADAGTAWSGSGAAGRVFDWATDGDTTDWGKYAKAFLYRDDSADKATKGAYKLGIADVVNGHLEIIPKAVYAVAGVLSGARGGTDIPMAQQNKIKATVRSIYKQLAKALDDKSITAPFALTAAAGKPLPPLAWFANPGLTELTPITITDDGRVFGHAAPWGVCHIGLPGCVTAPQSFSNYAYFTTGATLTDSGEIPTGKLTVGEGHADGDLGFAAAAEHYDNVCTAVATVTAGEDEFGVWVAGSLLPDATPGQVEALRQSPLSGDWRSVGGNLELVAAHAVNVPGFPVPRARAVVAAGRQLSLVAAGVPHKAAEPRPVVDVVALAEQLVPLLRESLTAAGPAVPAEVPSVALVDDGALRRAQAKLKMLKIGD